MFGFSLATASVAERETATRPAKSKNEGSREDYRRGMEKMYVLQYGILKKFTDYGILVYKRPFLIVTSEVGYYWTLRYACFVHVLKFCSIVYLYTTHLRNKLGVLL